MRILHTSDWHLGKILYGKSLHDDQQHFVEQFLSIVDEVAPQAILLSGDVFDRAIAPKESIKLFDYVLEQICLIRAIDLIIITGNHDSAERFTLGSSLLKKNKLHIISDLNNILQPIELFYNKQLVNIFAIPFFNPGDLISYFPDEFDNQKNISFNDAYKFINDKINSSLNTNAFNICLAHIFLTGAIQTDSENSIFVGTSGEVAYTSLSAFDYVALGHLHSPQTIKKKFVYSGSPLKYSFDNNERDKSIILLDIENNQVAISKISIIPLHDLQTLSGDFSSVISKSSSITQNNYIQIKLSGLPQINIMNQLREYFPNVLTLEYVKGKESFDKPENILHTGSINNELLILNEFFSQMCEHKLNESEIEILNHLLHNKGDNNDTN